eukprot:gene6407-8818_t
MTEMMERSSHRESAYTDFRMMKSIQNHLLSRVSVGVVTSMKNNDSSKLNHGSITSGNEPTPQPSNPTISPTILGTNPSLIPTYLPSYTNSPTLRPSSVRPTTSPSSHAPTEGAMCCEDQVYSDWQVCSTWLMNQDTPTTCSTCEAFSCIDWSMGSYNMKVKEADFKKQNAQNVYFAVGAIGDVTTSTDKAGFCYRLTIKGVNRDIIAQVIDAKGGVDNGGFSVQLTNIGSDGSAAACLAASSSLPMYPGNYYGWHANPAICATLPSYPICNSSPKVSDDLQELCSWSFTQNLQVVGSAKPIITKMCQVACPTQLTDLTGFQRSDEPTTSYICTDDIVQGLGGSLSGYLNCAKPQYSWQLSDTSAFYPGKDIVVPCRRDGYTRINTKRHT